MMIESKVRVVFYAPHFGEYVSDTAGDIVMLYGISVIE